METATKAGVMMLLGEISMKDRDKVDATKIARDV